MIGRIPVQRKRSRQGEIITGAAAAGTASVGSPSDRAIQSRRQHRTSIETAGDTGATLREYLHRTRRLAFWIGAHGHGKWHGCATRRSQLRERQTGDAIPACGQLKLDRAVLGRINRIDRREVTDRPAAERELPITRVTAERERRRLPGTIACIRKNPSTVCIGAIRVAAAIRDP